MPLGLNRISTNQIGHCQCGSLRVIPTGQADRVYLKTKTVLGDFAVHERGFQVGQKAVTIQWQDGKQAVVWPEESATGKLRFPTPAWHQR